MIYAIWDDNQQQLQLANSGLPRRSTVAAARWRKSRPQDCPSAFLGHATYDELNVRGRKGDAFLFFSDGIWMPQLQGRNVWASSPGGDHQKPMRTAAPRS